MTDLDQAFERSDGDADECGRDLRKIGVCGKCLRLLGLQRRERAFQSGSVRQRYAHSRRMRVVRNEWFEIVEIVRNQYARERQVAERRLRRPIAQDAREAAMLIARAIGGEDVIDAAYD